jgi:hypothetical protein
VLPATIVMLTVSMLTPPLPLLAAATLVEAAAAVLLATLPKITEATVLETVPPTMPHRHIPHRY